MWRTSAVVAASLLLAACGSDFVSADARTPEPDVRTRPDTHRPPPQYDTTPEPDTRPTRCRPTEPQAGCPCDYKNTPRGVCRFGTFRDGACRAPHHYEAEESTCDNLDNDCDGQVDEQCAPYVCRNGECTINERPDPKDSHVTFHFKCPEGDKAINIPHSRATRLNEAGTCWRVICWGDGKAVADRWCQGE